MKKIVLILLIPIIFSSFKFDSNEDLIRIRVIANSNSDYDQQIKMNVSNNLKKELYELLKNEKDINNARNIIKSNLDKIDENVKKTLNNEYEYDINYGLNYFPEKKYKNKTYKEGNYESLLVTLGSGEGNNWWCILFPPICLMEAEESEEVEYNFFLVDIFNKIFS